MAAHRALALLHYIPPKAKGERGEEGEHNQIARAEGGRETDG